MIDVSVFAISHKKVVTKHMCKAAFKMKKLLSWPVPSNPTTDFISMPLSHQNFAKKTAFFILYLGASNDFRLISKLGNKDLSSKMTVPLPKSHYSLLH